MLSSIVCIIDSLWTLLKELGNALVLAAIIRTPSIRSTPHMIMLCSLAVSDFLVGLIAQPIYIAGQLTKDRFVDRAAVMMGFSLCGVSLWTYIRIYYFIRQHELDIRAQQQAVQSSDVENNLNVPRLKRSAINTFVFCVALIICYFPVYV